MKNPIQPLEKDSHGVLRFKENKIVRYLLDNGGITLNDLATMDFSQDDSEQFAQLIGYSLSGFGELSYVSDETYWAAQIVKDKNNELISRNNALREENRELKNKILSAIALFDDIRF